MTEELKNLVLLSVYARRALFEGAIKRTMIVCDKTGNVLEQRFLGAGKTSLTLGGGVEEITDYALNHFANVGKMV